MIMTIECEHAQNICKHLAALKHAPHNPPRSPHRFWRWACTTSSSSMATTKSPSSQKMALSSLKTVHFDENPECFVMEALRLAGFPSAGRTVMGETPKCPLRIGGNPCVLQKGQAVVHDFIEMNRDKTVFGADSDVFHPKRPGLLENVIASVHFENMQSSRSRS